jgi:hypothetical protein
MTLIGYSFGMDVWIGDVGLWRWRGMEQMMGMGLVIDGGSWLLWGGWRYNIGMRGGDRLGREWVWVMRDGVGVKGVRWDGVGWMRGFGRIWEMRGHGKRWKKWKEVGGGR